MKESYFEDIASHDDPESCVAIREGGGEASTGAHAGRVLSRENFPSGVPTLWRKAEGNTAGALWRAVRRLHVVVDPSHAWKLPAREPDFLPMVKDDIGGAVNPR